jgi:hypothetical protein
LTGEELGVLGAVNVVGHDGHRVALAELLAEFETEHGLAGADRTADADAWGAGHGRWKMDDGRWEMGDGRWTDPDVRR